jgi:hypothetical protein
MFCLKERRLEIQCLRDKGRYEEREWNVGGFIDTFKPVQPIGPWGFNGGRTEKSLAKKKISLAPAAELLRKLPD